MKKKLGRTFGWVIIIGWCILEIPFRMAGQISGAIEDPITGVPYIIGIWGVLVFGIWLVRTKRLQGGV